MFYKIVVPGAEPGVYRSCHGGTHTWVPGVTYGPVPVHPCYTGFHAARLGDLSRWLASATVVFEVGLTDVVELEDKVVGATAALGRRLGTLTLEGMVEFARRCSERAQGYGSADAGAARADAYRHASAAADRATYYAASAARAADDAAAAAYAADAAAYRVATASAAARAANYAFEAADTALASAAERELQGRDILSLLG